MKKQLKQLVRRIRRINTFMLHHITADENCGRKISLSSENFTKLISDKKINSVLDDEKGFLLTFDEGYEDFYTEAFPIIKNLQVPAVMFVTTSLINTPGYMTDDQLRELDSSGLVTIGSHCVNHKPLRPMTKAEKEFEVGKSKEYLESVLGHCIDYISYPYGQFDGDVLHAVKKCGYKKGFSAAEISFSPFSVVCKRYCLPRINITDSVVIAWDR